MLEIIECPHCGYELALSMKVKFCGSIEASRVSLEMEDIKVDVRDGYELKKRIFNDVEAFLLNKTCLKLDILVKYLRVKYNLTLETTYNIIEELKLRLGLYEEKGILYA